MKNRLFSIFTVLFFLFTFTSNSITQDLQNDPQQDDFYDGVKVHPEKILPKDVLIYDIAFSPDGNHLAVAGDFGILLYDTRIVDKPIKVAGNTGSVVQIAFSPDGKVIASVNANFPGTIRLLDSNTGELLRTINARTRKEDKEILIFGVSCSPDSNTIISRHNGHRFYGPVDNTIRMWDIDTGKLLRTLSGHSQHINAMAYCPESKIIATGSDDHTLRLWDADKGKLLHILSGHTDSVRSVAFSPDGRVILSGSGDRTLRLWDVNTGYLLHSLTNETSHTPDSVAFSPDGRTIASYNGFEIVLWDVQTGQILRKIRERYSVTNGWKIVFSPDGRTIASWGYQEVNLWNVNPGRHLRTLISGKHLESSDVIRSLKVIESKSN